MGWIDGIMGVGIGLIALSFLVVIHEWGHYAAAKQVGVKVEIFSIGWGKKLLSWKPKETEWRLSLLPLGGYCRLKGDDSEAETLDPDSLWQASPMKRIYISLAGPLANLIFAVLAGAAFLLLDTRPVPYYESRIVVPQENEPLSPAQKAGLQTGDLVVEVENKKITSFSDLRLAVSLAPKESLLFKVKRGRQTVELVVTPMLKKDSGIGFIGVSPWISPTVAQVSPEGQAEAIGLSKGDTILSIGETPLLYTTQIPELLEDAHSQLSLLVRNDKGTSRTLSGLSAELLKKIFTQEIFWQTPVRPPKQYNLLTAILGGGRRGFDLTVISIKGLITLFRGVNPLKVMAGPLRISYVAGTVATNSLLDLLNLLSLISVALFVTNLLPIPILDGGQIVLFSLEKIRARRFRPKTIRLYQAVGMGIIICLIFLVFTSDFLFFSGR